MVVKRKRRKREGAALGGMGDLLYSGQVRVSRSNRFWRPRWLALIR